MNPKEVGKQKFDHLKKRASLIAKTFVLGMLGPLGPLMMGCGYVNFDGRTYNLNDYDGELTVKTGVYERVPYDKAIHGKKIDFVELGERVPKVPNSIDGKAPIHRHHANALSGVYGYKYE